ncbi:MAG: TATA-box-binding protein C [Thaumarchaeota archaeon]|nr:TATA-box-binding protein C [Nitrososphaerota archaeon]
MQKLDTKLRSELKIQNTVSTADLKQKVDIARFNEYKHLSSNLDLYRCGYVKDDTMIGRVTIFRTGKMISVGTKSPKQADVELKKAVNILKNYKLAKNTRITSQTRNIVSRFDLKKSLPIEMLARTLPKSIYEPDQFPGLIYRIQGSCVALLFASGKGIIVGATSIEEINSAFFDVQSQI